jgi:phage terminase small subunit
MASKRVKGLNGKRLVFAREYLVDQNATAAAIRAGYSENTAKQQGSRLLTKADVQRFVQEGLEQRVAKLELTTERLDKELAGVCFLDPARLVDPETGTVLPLSAMPEDVRRVVRSVKVQEIFEGKGAERKQVGRVLEVKLEPKTEALRLAYERRALIDVELRLAALEGKGRR